MPSKATVKSFLYRHAIRIALRRPSPNNIPLAGDEARVRARNYFTVNLGDDIDRWRFLVLKQQPEGVSGLWFSGYRQEGEDASVHNHALSDYQLRITEYFGELEIRYTSALDFIAQQVVRTSWFKLCWERSKQFLFNRRKLVRTDRLKLLNLVVGKSIEDSTYRTSAFDIMSEFYGHRWARHPGYEQAHNYYVLLLDSLVSSGEMVKDDLAYRIAPKALESLAKHEEEDRKHQDELKQQRYLGFLTLLLVFVGVMQIFTALLQARK